MDGALFILSFVLVIAGGVGFYLFLKAQDKKVISRFKATYEEALRSGDKKKALEAGRAYYSMLRSNKRLTIYDEQAITNDLSTM